MPKTAARNESCELNWRKSKPIEGAAENFRAGFKRVLTDKSSRSVKKMKVILAIDGSDFSRTAIAKFSGFIAAPANTEIKLICVVEKPAPMVTEPFAVSSEYYHSVEAAHLKEAEGFVAEAVEQLRKLLTAADIKITTRTLLGDPDKEIIEIAREWNADLIVVGSHGRGFWERMLLGSVSDSIVHHAPCSVLVVRKPQNSNGSKG